MPPLSLSRWEAGQVSILPVLDLLLKGVEEILAADLTAVAEVGHQLVNQLANALLISGCVRQQIGHRLSGGAVHGVQRYAPSQLIPQGEIQRFQIQLLVSWDS